MALRFFPDAITGDRTPHAARRVPGHQEAWEVSWLPGRLLDRPAAVSAMALAEAAGIRERRPGDRFWPHLEGWAAHLGLTAPEALTRISQPPGGISAGRDATTAADPEAGS